jgi:hypothetical protein
MPFSLRFTPLLLSTVDATSPLLVVLLCTVVMTPQPLDMLLCFVYMSLQLVIAQLSSLQSVVDQLSPEIGGSHSELHLPLGFRLPAPLVSVPVLMTHCPIVLVTSHSGTCLIMDLPWALSLSALVPSRVCTLENEWVFSSCGVT